ncbi:MAG: hypothetical protein BroJett007_25990 [Chloroflexota bacterium]|nr:MAG: hypothetical protein BroJett007_25990 [Chloroflexota bacterium]
MRDAVAFGEVGRLRAFAAALNADDQQEEVAHVVLTLCHAKQNARARHGVRSASARGTALIDAAYFMKPR